MTQFHHTDNGAAFSVWDFIDHQEGERMKYKSFPREWHEPPKKRMVAVSIAVGIVAAIITIVVML